MYKYIYTIYCESWFLDHSSSLTHGGDAVKPHAYKHHPILDDARSKHTEPIWNLFPEIGPSNGGVLKNLHRVQSSS